MNMLSKFGTVAVGFVALVHIGISIVEMFFWKHPRVYDQLKNLFNSEVAIKAAPIVVNAGLYNGFVAAGLIWGLLGTGDNTPIKLFFLVCVIVAGIIGSITLKSGKPLVLQTFPGAVSLLLVWVCRI